ncbi:hypothetical protein SKA34_13235 [Photobacterium sp. SKA34]|nr:hypothetical protein SKA34_13235 [Photobacterium sp. SKA34]
MVKLIEHSPYIPHKLALYLSWPQAAGAN